MRTRVIALAPLFLAAAVLGGCERVSDAAFGARVHAYLMKHPEVIEEAAQRLEQVRAENADRDLKVNISRNRPALERDKRDFVANPDGKITVVEFFDYRCGYCKKAAPDIVRLIAENPDVRFVFKELPIFGGISDEAAAIALAANTQGRYLSVYRSFFATNLSEETIAPALASEGLSYASLKSKAGSDEIKRHLSDNHRLASNLGVNGTPTFFIGDTAVIGADIPAIEDAIKKARAAKTPA